MPNLLFAVQPSGVRVPLWAPAVDLVGRQNWSRLDYSDSTLVIPQHRQNTVSCQYARQFAGRERGGAPHPGAKASSSTHGNLRIREPVHGDQAKQGNPRSLERSSGRNMSTVGPASGTTDLYCRSLPRPGRGSKSRLWSGHGTLGRENRPQNSIMGFFQRRQGLDLESQGRKAVQVSKMWELKYLS